ncbi:hypothetical protein RIF23_18430 [Lipingzhangella sp. LS1_29]|uniref:Bacteriocin n=1 Tax=Lipingzhangella rawalii TaxID=2055835 RepID=A0ABU2HBU1_9ACTN|nr:hypothetical protein [Lipingzhangella rawalii]MDS1272270.1 hypothetical protein [Lipingzhangella rawalii]
METLLTTTNERSEDLFGALDPHTQAQIDAGTTPVLATPAAAAAGAAATAGAFGAGVAVGYAVG